MKTKEIISEIEKLPSRRKLFIAEHILKSIREGGEEMKDAAQKTADNNLIKDIEDLASESNSFAFLKEEEELYTINDLKEKY